MAIDAAVKEENQHPLVYKRRGEAIDESQESGSQQVAGEPALAPG